MRALPFGDDLQRQLALSFRLTKAYRIGDGTVVVALDFLRNPFIAVLGWQRYGEPLDRFAFMGGASIIAGILFSPRAEAQGRGRA